MAFRQFRWPYKDGYKPKGIDETIPDRAMSLREIVNRSIALAPLPTLVHPDQFDDEEDFDDFDPVVNDLTDIEAINERSSYLYRKIQALKEAKQAIQASKQKVGKPISGFPTEQGEVVPDFNPDVEPGDSLSN